MTDLAIPILILSKHAAIGRSSQVTLHMLASCSYGHSVQLVFSKISQYLTCLSLRLCVGAIYLEPWTAHFSGQPGLSHRSILILCLSISFRSDLRGHQHMLKFP